MVNSDDFSKRLQKLMEFYEINAASFADSIDVGRSSISHILSGRNKPSLDFVLKIVQTYPEVELYWLLNGKGDFPSTPINAPHNKPPIEEANSMASPPLAKRSVEDPGSLINTNNKKRIAKIVIFYEDGSFEAYNN